MPWPIRSLLPLSMKILTETVETSWGASVGAAHPTGSWVLMRSLLSKRNRSFALMTAALLALGCGGLPNDYKVASLSFRSNPLDHRAGEAIEQIEVIAPSVAIDRARKLPIDWTAGVSHKSNGVASCLLGCNHQYFAESNIHCFDGLVSIHMPTRERTKVKVRIWVTRGPLGPGRIVDLDESSLILR